jgi:hypothetical protein
MTLAKTAERPPLAPPTEVLAAQIEALELDIQASDGRVRALVVASATGDAKAGAEAARLRGKRADMDRELADLRAGFQQAQEEAQTAATAERQAQVEAGRAEVAEMSASRIEAAADFDRAAAAMQSAYSRFVGLGEAMASHPQGPLGESIQMSHWDNHRGDNRVLAALPPLARKFFPQAHFPTAQVPLAESEAGQRPARD